MKRVLHIFLIIGLVSTTIFGQNAIDLTKPLPMDGAVKVGKLKNGMTYYIRKNVEPKNRAQLRLVVKAGSILETDAQQGLAHFMEHMAFNGTKNFPKNELVNFLQKSGLKFGADLNAYTSFDETVYQLPVPTDTAALFEKYFLVLSDWANKAALDPTEIDKERGVVLEESRLRKGAGTRINRQLLPAIFKGSLYANRLPIGIDSILQNFKHETLSQFYKDWYRPDLEAVIAVGDFDVNQVEAYIQKYFGSIPAIKNPKERKKFSVPMSGGTDAIVITDKEQPYHIIQMFYKHPELKEISGNDRRTKMTISLFNSMIGQRLQELLQTANPPFQYGASNYSGFYGHLDALTVFAVAKNGDVEKALKAVIDENERARKFGFTASEFERAKKQYLTGIENQFKEKDKTNSEAFTDELVNCFTNDVVMTDIAFDLDFAKQHLEGIKLDEVNALAGKFITKDNRVVALIAPEKDKEKLPTAEQLKTMIDNAGKDITAYIDAASDKPLLSQLPTGTRTVAEQQIPAIGITELTLGNGLKVILKPTDFKNDEIKFRGTSWGGSSLYDDKDYESAMLASSIVSTSGVSDFSAVQLNKYLTGKISRVNAYVTPTTEMIFGNSSVKDLETTLQLIYARFTKNRKDDDAIKGFLGNQRDFLTSQLKTPTPEKVYADTLAALMGGYTYRAMPMTIERLDKVNPERAIQIFNERFADASDFIFTFVGNFKVDEIKPLLERYLGGLPSTKSKETFKDLKANPPTGQVTKTVYKGTEDKATVTLIFTGNYTPSRDEDDQIGALGDVLGLKLIDKLREEESGVYSPQAYGRASKTPSPRYTFQVKFGCSPANVDKLINVTLREIEKIRKDGGDPSDIQKFKIEQKRDLEEQLKNNDFWLSYISSKYQYNEDPKEVLTEEQQLEKITVESTKQTANKYLSGDNFIKMILLPEKK